MEHPLERTEPEPTSRPQALLITIVSSLVAIFLTISSLVWVSPMALATGFSSEPTVLTAALLNQRIASPVRKEGRLVIDLQNLTIDLRSTSEPSEQIALASHFYQQLQKALNSHRNGSIAPGLDLSVSLIQGELDLTRLGLRVPASGGVELPALTEFREAFEPTAVPVGKLARWQSPSEGRSRNLSSLRESLLIQPRIRPAATQLDTRVFQGPLLLNQTCFNGEVKATGLYFLERVEATGSIFTQKASWKGAQFARSVNFSRSQFQQESSFRTALFGNQARFNQAIFSGPTRWQRSSFHGGVSFSQAAFREANFSRSHWHTNADFDQAQFHAAISFQKSRFDQALFLTDTQLESDINFRQAQFQQPVSLRGARILNQLDFGDARFSSVATVNVADLDFNAGTAQILGSPGQIGQVFSVPTLASNETVLRNLVRNFRLLEQVSDANQIEYTTERLRLEDIRRKIFGLGLNQASRAQLSHLGLEPLQVQAVISKAQTQPFVSRADLLSMDEIDLATYLKVRDRITVHSTSIVSRAQWSLRWLLLAGLLLLSDYGTNTALTFSVGIVATALFGILFWGVDRYRRRLPSPIVPDAKETAYALCGGGVSLLAGLAIIYQYSDYPLRALAAVCTIALPVPALLLVRLYQQGRYHDLMDSSYFVKNNALRRLQVLIARLPIIPQYPFYRDRYQPLLMDRRWSWLDYYDFSLNNWFKFGFNDIRLRDKAVPGLVSALVWYQWLAGTGYIALLLWTLSRTIPGLNLLLYF